MSAPRLLFVCTGNLCRSPFAAALTGARAAAAGRPLAVASCGIHAEQGRSCPPEMVDVAASYGIDLSTHRARAFAREDLERYDHVLALDLYHLDFLAAVAAPEHRGRVDLMKAFAGLAPRGEVLDPYGRGARVYRRVADDIARTVDAILKRLTVSTSGR